ncbi:MAG TPA: TetR/AcrR family transcriptional regulator [Candidatus Polarisedimenticolaceae bacterium]|nr:TetR/AcrR family transcriptional regulator [Candidatus Polarisedimenticolaceae bacterium]
MSTLRERISAAAQELYLREGIEGLSMRKLAEVVGVSATALYRHYGNKDEILHEIVMEGLKILEGYVRPALEAPGPREKLQLLIRHYLDFALEQPKYFDFAFMLPSRMLHQLPDEFERQASVTFKLAVYTVGECMECGVLRRDEPLRAALTLWAHLHGLVTLYRAGRLGNDPEQFRATYHESVERLLRGLAP